MKTARIILYIVIISILALYGAALIVKSDYKVERSTEIKADYEVVFPLISNLKEMRLWSPWHDRDTLMEEWYEGTDGAPGSIHRWKGNDEVGEGEQEIISIRPDRIDMEIRFQKPFKATNPGWILIDTKDSETVSVTWGFSGKIPRPLNLMLLFSDLEEAIGKDYEEGLSRLKALAEKRFLEKNPYKDILVQDVYFEPRFFIFKSITTSYKNLLHDALTVGKSLNEIFTKKDLKPYGNLVAQIISESDSLIRIHVGFPVEKKMSFSGFESAVLPEGDFYFLPLQINTFSTEQIPEIIREKVKRETTNQRILIDFLEYENLQNTGKGLIGVFVLK